MHFRDMQEQGTFHEGREYERKILTKRIKELEEQLKEEYSRGIRDGLNQATEIVKNC